MNTVSADMQDYLSGLDSSSAVTYPVHCYSAPDTPDAVIILNDTGGLSPQPHGIYQPTFQAVVRGKKGNQDAIYAQATALRLHLHEKANITVNGTRYIEIWQMGDIFTLPDDDLGRPRFSINFRCKRT